MRGHLREVAAEVLITDRPDPHRLRGPGDLQRKQEPEAEGAAGGRVPALRQAAEMSDASSGENGRRV
jgi:hypothetical protein